MGGMDNSSSCNHGYHRQVSSSCFTWSVLCPSMAKMFSWWHFPVEKPFPVAAGLMKLHLPSSPSHSPLPPFPPLPFPPLPFPLPLLSLSIFFSSLSVLLRPPPSSSSSSLLFPFFLSFPSSSPIPHRLQACGHIQARLAVKTWMELIWPTGLLLTTSALSLLQLLMEENQMPQDVGKRGQMFHFVKQR